MLTLKNGNLNSESSDSIRLYVLFNGSNSNITQTSASYVEMCLASAARIRLLGHTNKTSVVLRLLAKRKLVENIRLLGS